MTKQQLIDKLNDLEWEDFEVKAAKAEVPKSAWETVSAFSNTAGGWLVFGVKQNKQNFIIEGISNGYFLCLMAADLKWIARNSYLSKQILLNTLLYGCC